METAAPIPNAEAQIALSPWQIFWRRLKRRRPRMAARGFDFFTSPCFCRIHRIWLRPDRTGFFYPPTGETVGLSSRRAALRTIARQLFIASFRTHQLLAISRRPNQPRVIPASIHLNGRKNIQFFFRSTSSERMLSRRFMVAPHSIGVIGILLSFPSA
jgi:hypothetical protein